MTKPFDSSWETSSAWYDKIVGEKGHYYHEHLILPNVIKRFKSASSVIDLGCGQGILARSLPPNIPYLGIDASKSLIQTAKQHDKNKLHEYLVADLMQELRLEKKTFSHAAFILSLQNMEHPLIALQNTSAHLQKNGRLLIVINHPCFRIPRQSSWQVDESKKIQYRRIDQYMSPLKIPIQTHPSKEESTTTWSFHHPLSTYTLWLKEAGFAIEEMKEWYSDKTSTGKAAKMENRCRQEFPLFLAVYANKI